MIPRWKEETFAIILVKNHRKIKFFRRVTAISVYVVGDVTLLTGARLGLINIWKSSRDRFRVKLEYFRLPEVTGNNHFIVKIMQYCFLNSNRDVFSYLIRVSLPWYIHQ